MVNLLMRIHSFAGKVFYSLILYPVSLRRQFNNYEKWLYSSLLMLMIFPVLLGRIGVNIWYIGHIVLSYVKIIIWMVFVCYDIAIYQIVSSLSFYLYHWYAMNRIFHVSLSVTFYPYWLVRVLIVTATRMIIDRVMLWVEGNVMDSWEEKMVHYIRFVILLIYYLGVLS